MRHLDRIGPPLAIASLLLVFSSMGCKRERESRQRTPAPSSVPGSPLPGPSSSEQPPPPLDLGFALALPPGWRELSRAPEGPVTYQSPDRNEQLTVSVLGSGARVTDRKKREQALTQLLETHQRALQKAMDFNAEFGPTVRSRKGEVDQARYSGMDYYAHRAFAVAIFISSTGAWAFTFESFVGGAATAEQAAAPLFDSVTVNP